jgi:hypothetical protein
LEAKLRILLEGKLKAYIVRRIVCVERLTITYKTKVVLVFYLLRSSPDDVSITDGIGLENCAFHEILLTGISMIECLGLNCLQRARNV